jgi:hypothetical protein
LTKAPKKIKKTRVNNALTLLVLENGSDHEKNLGAELCYYNPLSKRLIASYNT